MTNENTTFRPLDSLQVMAYIVDMCRKQHIEVNVTKLQKLLYCCYGVALAQLGIRLTKVPVSMIGMRCTQISCI